MNAPTTVAAVLLGVPLILNVAAYLDRRRAARLSTDCGAEPLPPAVASIAFVTEWAALFVTLMACAGGAVRRRTPMPIPAARVVVLLPDYALNVGSFWLLRRRLRRAGWLAVLGSRRTSLQQLDAAVPEVSDCVQRLRQAAPQAPLVLLGHGTGGLLARVYLQRHPEVSVQRLVTLGTAHQGSSALAFRWPPLSPARAGAPLLQSLAADPLPERVESVAIASEFDAWATPASAAYFPGAFNIDVRAVGHFALLTSRRISSLVLENLPHAPR